MTTSLIVLLVVVIFGLILYGIAKKREGSIREHNRALRQEIEASVRASAIEDAHIKEIYR